MKMVMVNIESRLPPGQRFEQLSHGLTALLPYLSVRNACINLAFWCLIGYFLFFSLKFPSYSLVLLILLLFFCFGLVVVPFVAMYGTFLFFFFFLRRTYGSFYDDLLSYGRKNLVFSILVYFSCCLIIYHYKIFL